MGGNRWELKPTNAKGSWRAKSELQTFTIPTSSFLNSDVSSCCDVDATKNAGGKLSQAMRETLSKQHAHVSVKMLEPDDAELVLSQIKLRALRIKSLYQFFPECSGIRI